MSRRFAGVAILLAAVTMTVAAAERTHDIELEDYFSQVYVSTFAVSPAGDRIAFIEGRWDEGLDGRNMDLWTVDVASGQLTRLTFDPASDGNPQWSADGRWIYFTSGRKRGDEKTPYDGKTQVWRVPVAGGDPAPVTRAKEGVQQYALAQDGGTLYYVTRRESVEEDHWKGLRKEFKDLDYGHGVVRLSVLRKLDLETWRDEMLVDEGRVIGAIALAPDESKIAMITTPDETLISNEGWSHVDIYHLDGERVLRLEDELWRESAPSPYGWIVGPTFSGDSSKLAFRVDFDGYPGEIFVAHCDGTDHPPITKVARPNEVSAEGRIAWRPGTHDLCLIGEDHARARLYAVTQVESTGHGPSVTLTPGDVVLGGYDFVRGTGGLYVLNGGVTHTADLFRVETPGPNAELVRLTNLNPQIDTWKLPQIQIVTWTSEDGTPVEGLLELPPDYQPGDGPLPMLVTIHGGPTSSSKLAYRFWIYGRTLYAAKGWAVFDPNYRGSTGYGDKFLTDLIGNKNNLDVMDILSGVDMLVAQGIADPDQLAVMGWSNGGYLTNCLITTTGRFKAASSGAGVFDTVMQWSIEDTPGHVINYSEGLPWENAKKMHDTSPLYSVDEVVTPTLIHVGENDPRVPVEHSRSLHRALHHYLDVPCELLIYPKTGHGLRKYTHRKAKLKWDMEWMEHHALKKTAEEKSDEVNE